MSTTKQTWPRTSLASAAAVTRAVVRLPEADRALLAAADADLRASGLIQELVMETAEAFEVKVELAGPEERTA